MSAHQNYPDPMNQNQSQTSPTPITPNSLKQHAKNSILYANFQSSAILTPNYSQAVTVKYLQKKEVKFNLDNNQEFLYRRDDAEIFTMEDKRQLSMLIWKNQQIQMQVRSGRIPDEDDDQSQDEEEIIVSVEPHPNIKGILKKDSSQIQVARKKRVFAFEIEDEIENQRHDKNFQQKENALLQKYDIGYHISLKQGFKIGQGLGKDGQGIQEPIQHVRKTEFTGEPQIQESKEDDEQITNYRHKKWLKIDQKKKLMLKKCNEDCYSNAIKMISTWADDMEEKNEKLKSECAQLEDSLREIDEEYNQTEKEFLDLKQQQSGLKIYITKLSNNLNMINISQLTLECRRLLLISPLMFMNLDFPQMFINLVRKQFKAFINSDPDKEALIDVHENLSQFFMLLLEIMQTKRGFQLSIYSDQQIAIKAIDFKQFQHLQNYISLVVQPLIQKFKSLSNFYDEQWIELLKVWNKNVIDIEIELKESIQYLKLIPDSFVQEMFSLAKIDLESNGITYFKANTLFVNCLVWSEIVQKQQITQIILSVIESILMEVDVQNSKYSEELKRLQLLVNQDEFKRIIQRKLMPRLCRAVEQVEINPSKQEIDMLNIIKEWYQCLNLFEISILKEILEKNIEIVFKKWATQQTLVKEEILFWLKGWETFFNLSVSNLINQL